MARNVQILGIDLLGAHFERADDDALSISPAVEATPDGAIAVEWKIDDNQHLLGCVLTFATVFSSKKEPYTIVTGFRLTYDVNPDLTPRLSKAELDQFAHWNAMFNAWPYWREYVSSTINRAHLPAFTVPIMTVPLAGGSSQASQAGYSLAPPSSAP